MLTARLCRRVSAGLPRRLTAQGRAGGRLPRGRRDSLAATARLATNAAWIEDFLPLGSGRRLEPVQIVRGPSQAPSGSVLGSSLARFRGHRRRKSQGRCGAVAGLFPDRGRRTKKRDWAGEASLRAGKAGLKSGHQRLPMRTRHLLARRGQPTPAEWIATGGRGPQAGSQFRFESFQSGIGAALQSRR